jgi:hypothetical protein
MKTKNLRNGTTEYIEHWHSGRDVGILGVHRRKIVFGKRLTACAQYYWVERVEPEQKHEGPKIFKVQYGW